MNTAHKHALRTQIQGMLSLLGMYVEMNGGNDEEVLLSSGFNLRARPARKGMLAAADNFRSRILYGGMVKLMNSRVEGARSYQYEYMPLPITENSTWKIVMSTKASVIVYKLTKGTEYAFRVTGIGTNPAMVCSNIITSYAL